MPTYPVHIGFSPLDIFMCVDLNVWDKIIIASDKKEELRNLPKSILNPKEKDFPNQIEKSSN